MNTSRTGLLLAGLAMLAFNVELAAKCLPPTGSVRIKGADGTWTSIETAWFFAPSDLGTFHLAQGDGLEFTLVPDCPTAVWLSREGVVITSFPMTSYAVFLFAGDGEYRVEGEHHVFDHYLAGRWADH